MPSNKYLFESSQQTTYVYYNTLMIQTQETEISSQGSFSPSSDRIQLK